MPAALTGRRTPRRRGPAGIATTLRDAPRGVYLKVQELGKTVVGSSPLARGLHAGATATTGARGIIPARAGFTADPWSCHPWSPDHPRSRGVYARASGCVCWRRGSSPLARGLLLAGGERDEGQRIIPARAGFTGAAIGLGCGVQDHPRSRGVYARPPRAEDVARGSSPLARGLLRFTEDDAPWARIIPARAGFTRSDQWPR